MRPQKPPLSGAQATVEHDERLGMPDQPEGVKQGDGPDEVARIGHAVKGGGRGLDGNAYALVRGGHAESMIASIPGSK
jgi:hypothetical protein